MIDDHNIIKALGMIWQPEIDVFRFTWKPSEDPESVTKRTVLSEIARLFDPLGLIAPVVTLAKILFQSLWKCPTKLEWDTPLPDEYHVEWQRFKYQLIDLKNVSIPRHLFLPNDIKVVQLHAFSDASEKAYGTCIYVRTVYGNESVSVRLLTAKSRVSPTKTKTIAQLELCAGKLMVDVVQRMRDEVLCDIPIQQVHY